MSDSSAFNSGPGQVEKAAGELLPCPFCGGAAMCYRDQDGDFQVFCNAEGCTIETGHYGEEAEARAMWNRRSPAVSPDKGQG